MPMKRLYRARAAVCVLSLITCVLSIAGCAGGWGELRPAITGGVANQTVIAGNTATFHVVASAVGPVKYQWYKNGVLIPGATGSSYTTVVQAQDNGAIFSVSITDAAGTTVSEAVLTVQEPPSITLQPLNQTVTAGQSASLNVTASGTDPLSYQWYKNGASIDGATSASLALPTTNYTDNGSSYSVKVSNIAGSVTSNVAVLTVNPIQPNLVFAPVAGKSYGDTPFAISASSGSPGAITYSVVGGPATVSGNTVTITGAGSVVIAANQAASGDYAAARSQTTFNVAVETPTLTFASIPPKTFGDATFPVAATSASPGAVTYSVVSGPATMSSNTVTITGAGTVQLQANQAADTNHAAATAQTSFDVAVETPTLTFASVSQKIYGDAPFAVSATSASPATVTYSVVSGPATISGNTVTITGSGIVQLQANQAADTNYAAATAQTSFSVAVETPTLTFASISQKTYGDAPFAVSATSASSGTVTYSVISGPATISGNTATITGSGTVQLQANQAAAGNYATALATTSFNVEAKTPTLAFASIPQKTYGDASFAVSATSASSGTVTYSVLSGPATVSGNTVTLTGWGTVQLQANQAAAGNYGTALTTTSFLVAQSISISGISPAGATIAPGQQTFTAAVTGGITGSVQWSANGGSFDGNAWTSPNTPGTYTITATSAENPAVNTSTTITISLPVITQQPVSKNACSGYNPSLTTAANYATSYSWALNGNPLAINAPTITFNDATSASNGTYTCTATNSAGSVTTNAVTLNVVDPTTLTITSQPKNVSVYVTQTATFSAGVNGTGTLQYQWYKGAVGSGTAIQGGTSSTYTTGALTSADNNTSYYVTVSDPDCTGTTLTSNPATLSVSSANTAVPPTIIVQPSGQAVNVGSTATFNVQASGSGTLSYQWFRVPYSSTQVSNPTSGAPISGATSSSYTVPKTSTTQSNDGDSYFVVVKNAYGTAVSNRVVLATGPGIVVQINQQPQAQYIATGTLASFSVTATCTGCIPAYKWYWYAPGTTAAVPLSDGAVSSGALSGATVAGSSASALTLQNVPSTASAGLVYVVVKSTSDGTSQIAGTNALTSSTAGLFVGSLGAVGNTNPGSGLCNSSSVTWILNGTNPGTANGDVPYQNTTACTIQLTNNQGSEAAAVYWPTLISTANFSVSFTVALASSGTPADGFTMVLADPSQGATTSSIGLLGEGLGANGIPGFVLAFDTYQNGFGGPGSGCYYSGSIPCDPATVPYMAVGQGAAALWENPWSFVNGYLNTQNSSDYSASQFANATHSYVVTVVNHVMTVTMDGYELFTGTVSLPPAAYLGFTASTGGSMESVTFSNLTATVSAP